MRMSYSGHTRGRQPRAYFHRFAACDNAARTGTRRPFKLACHLSEGHSTSHVVQERIEISGVLNPIASLSPTPIPTGGLVLLPELLGNFLFFAKFMGLLIIQNPRTRQDELQS